MQSSKLGNSIATSRELSSELSDLIVREPRPANLLAMQLVVTPLLLAVLHIIQMCTQEQVIGVATRWIIALVQNVQAVWDGAIGKLVTNAMRADIVPSVLALDPYHTISKAVVVPRPFPTFIRAALIDVAPQLFRERAFRPDIVVMADDESARFALDVAVLRIGLPGDLGLAAAAAMAEAVGYFVEVKLGLNKLWGMLHGVIVSFQTLTKARDAREASPGIFAFSTRSF
jgi:hypothetical protein